MQPKNYQAGLADAQESIRMIKAEVDALQIAAARQSLSWYNNPSILIAVFALLFSFGTTIISYQQGIDQDERAMRAELRSLILRLNELPIKHYEAQKKYKDVAFIAGSLASTATNENIILANQGAEIIERIPDLALPSEYLAIANALQTTGQIEKSKSLVEIAANRATSLVDLLAARRKLGQHSFQLGDVMDGRRAYADALKIFEDDRFSPFNDYHEATTHALTEMFWAQNETIAPDCPAWSSHLASATTYLATLDIPPDDPILAQVNATLLWGCSPRTPSGTK